MKRIGATAALLASLATPLSGQTEVTVRIKKGKVESVKNNFEQPYGTYYILNKVSPHGWLYPSDFGQRFGIDTQIMQIQLYCSTKESIYPFFAADYHREMRGPPQKEPDVWLGVSSVHGNVILAKVNRESKRFKELHEMLEKRAYIMQRNADLSYTLPCPQ